MPEARTASTRSCQLSGRADPRAGAQQGGAGDPLRGVEQQLEADRAADRVAGVVEPRGDRSSSTRLSTSSSTSAASRRRSAARPPAGGTGWCRGRAGPTRRPGSGRARCSAAADHRVVADVPSEGPRTSNGRSGPSPEADGGDGHAVAPCRTMRARAQAASTRTVVEPEVLVVGWVAGERGHAALLGADVVVGGRQRGGHPVGVHPQTGEQVGGLGSRRRRSRRSSSGQRRPLGVPAAVGALVDLLGGGDVQGRGRARVPPALPGAPASRAPGWPCAASSTSRRRCPRRARRPPAGDRVEHVVGDPPPGVGAADGRVADAGDRRAPGVPERVLAEAERLDGRGVAVPRGLGVRRARPARPWCRRRRRAGPAAHERRQLVVGVEDAGQPAGGLEPERGGHRVLGQRPRHHRGVPVPARPARRARRPAPAASRAPRSPRPARPAPARCRRRPGWSAPCAASGARVPGTDRSRSSSTSGSTGVPPVSPRPRPARAGRRRRPGRSGRAWPTPARCRRRPAPRATPARPPPSPRARRRRTSGRRPGRRRATGVRSPGQCPG